MKKIYLLFVTATLAACSAEPLENEGLSGLDTNLEGKSNNKVAVQVAGESFDVPELICAGEEATFTFNFNDKPGKISLKVQLKGDDPTTVEVEEWYNIFNEQFEGGGPENFYYTFEEAGDYMIRYQIGGGGFTNLSLVVENCGCEESFTYLDNGNGTYTFTYVPAEDFSGAKLTFTFPQDVVNSAPAPFSQNGGGNDTTFSANVDLVKCQTYSWNFSLTPDCRGKGQTEVNLWTDFKIGEDSKKEQFKLENIKKPCN